MPRKPRCLIVLAKEPKEGFLPEGKYGWLTSLECVELYKVFIRDTVSLAQKVECEKYVIAYESSKGNPDYLVYIGTGFDFFCLPVSHPIEQLKTALEMYSSLGYQIVVIDVVTPNLSSGIVRKAFLSLDASDVVLGPSEDGGCYLVGVNSFSDKYFANVIWGEAHSYRQLFDNVIRLGQKVSILDSWSKVENEMGLNDFRRRVLNNPDLLVARYTRRFVYALDKKTPMGIE